MTSNSTHNWYTPDRIRQYGDSLHLGDTVLVTLVSAYSLNRPSTVVGKAGQRGQMQEQAPVVTFYPVGKQREIYAVIHLLFLLIQSMTVTQGKGASHIPA